jgi:hypothetical protein
MMLLWQKRAMVNVVNHTVQRSTFQGLSGGRGDLAAAAPSGHGLVHEPRYPEIVGDLVQSPQ